VHGANRLGGNGVANSTVFGAVAGDTMAEWAGKEGSFSEPDRACIEQALARCEKPFNSGKFSRAPLEPLRERLYEAMWDKIGIIRDASGLRSGLSELAAIESELNACGIADASRAFNLSWHDWLNLKSLVETSRVIAAAALARTDSRGAHFREDFPESGPLESSSYTSLRMNGAELEIRTKPVTFSRVRPGQTLVR